ncbi:cytochrome c [Hymenobacter koreensis]|uniref:Cytochrome c domain-containing protein n=1 Tax=Hymenobacter koreensis TaxID=1084523 RepID=A0ABP8IYM5_9BACT
MNRSALELVFPVALFLLICTLVVAFSTLTGLGEKPVAAVETKPSNQSHTSADTTDSPVVAQLSDAEAAAVAAGDALFKSNCAQCHALNEVVIGPALAGIDQRRPLPWLVSWVKNSSKMVASGDEYAVKIFNEYQQQQMPSFALSAAEVESILAYIRYAAPAETSSSDYVLEAVASR